MKLSIFMILVLLISFSSFETQAQELNKKNINLTGVLSLDSKIVPQNQVQINESAANFQTTQKKSRWLAGLFSLVLPGAGEMYSGSYVKGAIFTLVEAAAITTALIYNHKGDTQTNFFQNFANQNWDVSKYAAWTMQHINDIPGAENVDPSTYHVFRNGVDWKTLGNGSNWAALNNDVDWNELNRLESALGGGYTHQLPYPGEQQYYELIGKYPQYSQGWSEIDFNGSDYHWLYDKGQPEGGYSTFLWYSHQRGLANEYYQTGSTAVVFIYINHFLSALDAIWTTDRYNNTLAFKFRVDQDRYANHIEFVPTVHVAFNF